METVARHRRRRTARAFGPALVRIAASVGLTALLIALGTWWYPQAIVGAATLPTTYAVASVAAGIVLVAVGVRAWTGSDLAAFLAEAAPPLAALTVILLGLLV